MDLYSFRTPNGCKVSIALEELGLPYRVHPVDITRGEQFTPAFLALNPNHKIPVLVDEEGPEGAPLTLSESGAILLYLAEKSGSLLPITPSARWEAVQWLMFQMGSVGPMFGQYSHFAVFAAEKVPYALERYRVERERLLGVLETRLKDRDYLAGTWSVADIATFPWVSMSAAREPSMLQGNPAVRAWAARVAERPAVQRGMQIP